MLIFCDQYVKQQRQRCSFTLRANTVTEYLCRKRSKICSMCCNHNPVCFSCMTCHQSCNKSYTTGATCGAGTPELTSLFSGVCVARSLVFCVLFCRPLLFFFWQLYCLSFDIWLLITPWIISCPLRSISFLTNHKIWNLSQHFMQ